MTVLSPSFDQISPALEALTPREAQVIKLRFGLEDCGEHTLEAIGQSLSLTRERVRQIEAKALEKLRSAAVDAESVRRYQQPSVD